MEKMPCFLSAREDSDRLRTGYRGIKKQTADECWSPAVIFLIQLVLFRFLEIENLFVNLGAES